MKKLLVGAFVVAGLCLFLPARWFSPKLAGSGPDPCILRDSKALRKMIRVAR